MQKTVWNVYIGSNLERENFYPAASPGLFIVDNGDVHLWNGSSWTELTNQTKFVPLKAPLTSTLWDGDAYSSGEASPINLNTVFGVPAGVEAVLIQVIARDSAVWGTAALYLSVGPTEIDYWAVGVRPAGGDVWSENNGVCPCDADGNVYCKIQASGENTLDAYIRIWGYFL